MYKGYIPLKNRGRPGRYLKEKLEILSEILNNYISDMEAYITPENPGIPCVWSS